jgi:hypothetical protein
LMGQMISDVYLNFCGFGGDCVPVQATERSPCSAAMMRGIRASDRWVESEGEGDVE